MAELVHFVGDEESLRKNIYLGAEKKYGRRNFVYFVCYICFARSLYAVSYLAACCA